MKNMEDQVVLRVFSKIMIPFIIIFGFYVITHGELGPGGGFQGGVILASAFILYGLVFGKDQLAEAAPPRVVEGLAAFGVLLYSGVGAWCLLAGGNFLDYSYIIPPAEGAVIPHLDGGAEIWGMILVEYGVGITVCTVMITVYNMITEEAEA